MLLTLTVILATNAAEQIILWTTELVNQIAANWGAVSTALAFGLSIYLGMTLWGRLQTDDDPSLRMQSQSAGGSMSILISGAHVTGLLLLAIAFLTWPLAVREPAAGALMVGVFAGHYYVEKREVDGN